MIITLFILFILFIHTVGIGHLFLSFLKASNKQDVIITSFIGSFFIMLILNLSHFLFPIGIIPFIIISIISLIGCFDFLKRWKPKYDFSIYQKIVLISCIVYLLIRGALYPSWTDSNLYHAQVIQWYTTYPITKGIANLFCAYGLNSNFHLFASLYTFNWLDINIPNASILYFEILFSFFLIIRMKEHPILGIILLWFFVAFWGWESSPSPDMVVTVTLVCAGIIYLSKEKNKAEVIFLILVILFSVTLKQSAFVIVLLLPFVLIKNKLDKRTYLILFLVSISTYLLWIIRNLILSGYPLFPLSSFDFFSFQHKVPKELVEAWTIQVTHFARRPIDSWKDVIGQPFETWAPYWFDLHRKTDRLLMLFTSFNIIYVLSRFRRGIDSKSLLGIIIIALFFWLFKVSTMRFAYGYMFLLTYICYKNYYHSLFYKCSILLCLSLFTAGTIFTLQKDFNINQLLLPEDYKKAVTEKFHINKQEIHVPLDINCKNTPIPCMYLKPETSLKMFSHNLSDGFYQSIPLKIDIEERGY